MKSNFVNRDKYNNKIIIKPRSISASGFFMFFMLFCFSGKYFGLWIEVVSGEQEREIREPAAFHRRPTQFFLGCEYFGVGVNLSAVHPPTHTHSLIVPFLPHIPRHCHFTLQMSLPWLVGCQGDGACSCSDQQGPSAEPLHPSVADDGWGGGGLRCFLLRIQVWRTAYRPSPPP